MSIIPASRLSASDLALLGNNLSGRRRQPAYRPSAARPNHRLVATINRSLACVGERIDRSSAGPASSPAVA